VVKNEKATSPITPEPAKRRTVLQGGLPVAVSSSLRIGTSKF
jgi:hypothetical protein